MRLHRKRDAGCLSDFAVDRWLADESTKAEVAAHQAHLASCAECTRRVDEARDRFAAFPAALPEAIAVSAAGADTKTNTPVRHVVNVNRWAPLAGGLALAAALVLGVRSRSGHDELVPSERTKGSGGRITFRVRHDGIVRQGIDGDRLEPGDAVQFSYTSRSDGYLAILSVDGARHASVYFADGDRAARVEAGDDVALAKSTLLDATLGSETIYALFCVDAVPVGPLRSALDSDPSRPPSWVGCTTERHDFVKVAR